MLIEVGGADLHLKSNSPIHARIKSDIALLSQEVITHAMMEKLVQQLMKDKYNDFNETKEFDGLYTFNDDFRFRVNIYMHLNGYSIALRLIPKNIKSIEELSLPLALRNLTQARSCACYGHNRKR
jgi:twitching motility protein PilT